MARTGETPVIDFGAIFRITQMSEGDEPYSDHVSEIRYNPDHFLKWFNRGGVDRAVLSDPGYMGHHDTDETASVNDDLLDLLNTFDEFYGLAAVPVRAGGGEAAAEFERSLDNGFNGGAITTTAKGRDMTDPIYEPVFEVANRTGAPLLVHPSDHSYLDEYEPDGYVLTGKYQTNHMFGREARMCGSIMKVINAGVLDKYENLNLVYHHHGGNIASMMGRIELRMQRRSGEYMKGRSKETKPFEEIKDQMEARLYIDTSGYFGYNAPTRTALEQLPASNIVFGTDAPAEQDTPGDLEDYVGTIADVAPRTETRQILGQNALDLMVNL